MTENSKSFYLALANNLYKLHKIEGSVLCNFFNLMLDIWKKVWYNCRAADIRGGANFVNRQSHQIFHFTFVNLAQ